MIKKIIFWIWLTILSFPAILVFNDNYDTLHLNFVGLLYCYLLYKNWDRLLTEWMRNYWDSLSKEPDDDDTDD